MADLRAELLYALHARGKVRERGDIAEFRCPRHDDSTPSAWLGSGRWGCHACGFEEPLETLASELGVSVTPRGYTVEQYADEKGLNLPLLARWGVHTGQDEKGRSVLVIPYRDAGGTVLRNRLRGANGAKWWEGRHRPIYLYGLDQLRAAASERPVILVEGESDCHAAWEHEVVAVGLPGAATWRSDWRAHLEGRTVFVWQEPDKAGEQLVRSLAADLPTARVIQADGVKDLADLHGREGGNFRKALHAMMEAAVPIGVAKPPITFDVVLGATLDEFVRDAQRPVDAVPTPLPAWNSVCRDEGGGVGLARGWYVTVAGGTGHGKSLLAVNIGSTAIRHGERVAFVSLEMSKRQLVTRLLAIHSGVPVRVLERGREFDVAQARAATEALERTHAATGGCFFVNRAPISKLEDILACIRYEHEVHGCRFFVLDYLQLAWTGADSLYENVAQVSHRVRQLVVDLDIVCVALSQFNRATSTQQASPAPTGLLGSSAIENDSDQVAMLDHTKYQRTPTGAIVDVLVGKNRHGDRVRIPCTWNYRTLRITEDVGDWTEINPTDQAAARNGRRAGAVQVEDRSEAAELPLGEETPEQAERLAMREGA